MSKYAQLDEAILDVIANHESQFSGITARVETEARAVAAKGPPGKPLSRYVDARLQSLRKQGLIKYTKGHWSIA